MMDDISVYTELMKLKTVLRQGWLRKGIKDPESVADHVYGVAILALTCPLPKGMDRNRLVKMALLEEAGETKLGDIVWESGASSDKRKRVWQNEKENAVVNELFAINQELRELALESNDQKTEMARFLKELDKLEMVFQAVEYESQVDSRTLDEFWENAGKYIKSKEVLDIFRELEKKRK